MNPILNSLQSKAGIVFMGQPGLDFQAPNVAYDYNIAMDAQPALISVSNAGVPAFLSTLIDPKLIEREALPTVRRQLLEKAEVQLLLELPIIPIYFATSVRLVLPAVHGWHQTPLDRHPYKHVWLER